jgi:hypothetical protein
MNSLQLYECGLEVQSSFNLTLHQLINFKISCNKRVPFTDMSQHVKSEEPHYVSHMSDPI